MDDMDKNAFNLIEKAMSEGDWSNVDALVSRKDLMDYLLFKTKNTSTKSEKIQCPLCYHNIRAYKTTITHRYVKFLMVLCKLAKQDDGTYTYVHYDDVNFLLKHHFKLVSGKNVGKGFKVTNYAMLTKHPWEFLTSENKTNDKTKRSGYFKPTDLCHKFLRGQVSVPESIYVMNNQVTKYSKNNVNVMSMKDMLFKDTVDLLKTF